MSESDSTEKAWSNSPNAPQIPYSWYFAEKTIFAGVLIEAVLYGIIIVLFFQCMGALLNSINRTTGGIKWPLVAHSTAMFSFVTIYTATTLHTLSITYIDNREFPGLAGAVPGGPFGYRFVVLSSPIGIVSQVMFLLNNWLADGLLLYRCCVIYSMNYWVITFPFLMYFASVATGIVFVHQITRTNVQNALALNIGIPYFSVSISLNVILTLMIITRLILHSRKSRSVLGAHTGASRLYKEVITTLIESSALCAITSLLFIVPWAAGSWVADIFLPLLAETQVIAPLLIVLRVANRSALTSSIVPETAGSTHFSGQRGSMSGFGTHPSATPIGSVHGYGKISGELGIGAEMAIDIHGDTAI